VAALAKQCPGGVLVFFPSYASLEAAVGAWKGEHGGQVWHALEAAKAAVLVEPR
jgi:Rad3-related DNA helicase